MLLKWLLGFSQPHIQLCHVEPFLEVHQHWLLKLEIQNDKQFVVASWRNYIQIRAVKTGKQLHFLDLSYLPERGVKRANISFDEKRIVTAQKDGTARVWDMDILRNRKQNPFENQTPQQLWLKVQQQLGLTLDENDQVVPLYPGGPRELIGWTGELKLLLHQESEKGPQ